MHDRVRLFRVAQISAHHAVVFFVIFKWLTFFPSQLFFIDLRNLPNHRQRIQKSIACAGRTRPFVCCILVCRNEMATRTVFRFDNWKCLSAQWRLQIGHKWVPRLCLCFFFFFFFLCAHYRSARVRHHRQCWRLHMAYEQHVNGYKFQRAIQMDYRSIVTHLLLHY